MPSHSDEIRRWQDLLIQHRRNAQMLRQQLAVFGKGMEPLHILNQLEAEEGEIRKAKAALRELGESPESLPGDPDEVTTLLSPASFTLPEILPGEQLTLAELLEKLDRHFNESELREVCFILQLDYKDIKGKTKKDKARELISYFDRQERLGELVSTCRQLRPHVSWGEWPSAHLQESSISQLPHVESAAGIPLTDLEHALLQHIHSNCKQVLIEKEFGGGYSGTRVFLVLPVAMDNRSHARVVTKMGPAPKLRHEYGNYQKYVDRALPFTVARVREYYEQADQAALNYVFAGDETLGQTVSLEEYYRTHTAEAVKSTLDGLLNKSLGSRWYRQTQPLNCLFRTEYGRHLPAHEELEKIVGAVFPDLSPIDGNRIRIPEVTGTYPHPLKVYRGLLDKTLEGRQSFVHGDLHLRNVLVDESGKGWLIDFAKVTERHNLFDFIKLETYVRLMALAPDHGAFSWNDYAQFERVLNSVTLGSSAAPPPDPRLRFAYEVIQAIRDIAQNYMGDRRNFEKEYLPALFLYCLAMLKYYSSNGVAPTRLIFITVCALAADLVGDRGPIEPAGIEHGHNATVATGQPATNSQVQHDSHSDDKIDRSKVGDITGSVGVATGHRVQAIVTQTTGTGSDIVGRDKITNVILPGDAPRPGSAPPLPTLVIGREDDLRNLKSRLGIEGEGPASLQVLTAIRGWPGIGKTTIAAVLAHDPQVMSAFPDGVLWVSLGPTPNLFSELATWGRALGTDDLLHAKTLEEAAAQLTALLRNKRMLLIVDDVWQPEHAVPFKVGGRGCATLITTRVNSVAQALAPTANDIYRLPVLTDDKALELLEKLAPNVVASNRDQCMVLVKELEGLPLALQIAGHMLNVEASYGFGVTDLIAELSEGAKLLEAKAPADRTDLANETTPTIAVLLQRSTERLDDFTRDCYAYLGVFAPKPATFDLAAMKAVWQVEDPKPVARTLVDRGLLEFVQEMERYRMHALLVMHAKSLLTED